MRQIILASGSPRRKELLASLGLPFTVIPSDFEEYLDDTKSPAAMAVELGLGKARAVAERYPDAIVIGSDTIVTVNGHHLGKAADVDEARHMWRLVTAGDNLITSSLAVVCIAESHESAQYDQAHVLFKPYDAEAVEVYLATGDYIDKAGAWSVQNARHLMQRVDGDMETIMGLPVRLLDDELRQLGCFTA